MVNKRANYVYCCSQWWVGPILCSPLIRAFCGDRRQRYHDQDVALGRSLGPDTTMVLSRKQAIHLNLLLKALAP